jgi:negative regulator of genetic competence, sporulation and motility
MCQAAPGHESTLETSVKAIKMIVTRKVQVDIIYFVNRICFAKICENLYKYCTVYYLSVHDCTSLVTNLSLLKDLHSFQIDFCV